MASLLYLVESCFWYFLVLPLAITAIVGFNLSLILSLFQLQEASLTFLVKITVFFIAVYFLANFFIQTISEVYNQIYYLIVAS